MMLMVAVCVVNGGHCLGYGLCSGVGLCMKLVTWLCGVGGVTMRYTYCCGCGVLKIYLCVWVWMEYIGWVCVLMICAWLWCFDVEVVVCDYGYCTWCTWWVYSVDGVHTGCVGVCGVFRL